MSINTPRFSRITGTGSYLPPDRVTNEALAARLARDGIETSDEWIVERTGIRARHFAASDVPSSELAVHAARHALEAAGRKPQDIDLIIVATSTPDMVSSAGRLLSPPSSEASAISAAQCSEDLSSERWKYWWWRFCPRPTAILWRFLC